MEQLPRSRITISEVTHELFIDHVFWCPKGPLKKFIETFSWYLYAGKLKTEQKLIVLSCLHSPPYLFSRKICTQSHSADFLNWGDHVKLVPDLAASPPWATQTDCVGALWFSLRLLGYSKQKIPPKKLFRPEKFNLSSGAQVKPCRSGLQTGRVTNLRISS